MDGFLQILSTLIFTRMWLNINHTSQNHFKSLNNDHYVHRAARYLHFLMGQVRSKHPDLLTSLARHTYVWDLCLAGVPDSSGNSYKPEVKGQGLWLTELTQCSPLTYPVNGSPIVIWSKRLQYSQRNNAQTENSWLISHLKIISGCMLGWLNEKIRIPHSNWSPYCEYQMKTFRNLPDFHRIPPPLFRKKKIHLYCFCMFSLANVVFKIVVQTLHIMVDTMVGKIKKKQSKTKQPVKLTSSLQTGNEKIQMLFELTAELTAFAVLFPQNNAMQRCTFREKVTSWLCPHTNTCMCEKGKRRLR